MKNNLLEVLVYSFTSKSQTIVLKQGMSTEIVKIEKLVVPVFEGVKR